MLRLAPRSALIMSRKFSTIAAPASARRDGDGLLLVLHVGLPVAGDVTHDKQTQHGEADHGEDDSGRPIGLVHF